MRTRPTEAGFSLLELLLGVVIGTLVVLAIFSVSSFATRQVGAFVERYNMYAQMSLALDTMQVVMPSATRISEDSLFNSVTAAAQDSFAFTGEENPYKVTPANFADNAQYEFGIDARGNLVMHKTLADGTATSEILIDGKYRPALEFKPFEEPNFLVVTISASSARKQLSGLMRTISKVEGIRFWFASVVREQN